jgi:Carboxypeptidase regulatory-like domain
MRNSSVLTFISGLLLIATLAAAADLSGRVTARGTPLAGAVVTADLIGPHGVASVTVTRTDARGQYVFRGLANGSYILLVDMNGRRLYQGRVTLNGGVQAWNVTL